MNYLRLESSLTTAAEAQRLADSLLAVMPLNHVELDFADVELCTPSFANALVMTLLARMTLAELKARCTMSNRRPAVAEIVNRAAVRFQQGIRLSNQRSAVVA